MLIQATALCFQPISNDDFIDYIIDRNVKDFSDNLVLTYDHIRRKNGEIDSNDEHILSSLHNYTVFNNYYIGHKNISYNSKNIIFETNTGLWEPFKNHLERYKWHRSKMKEELQNYGQFQSDIGVDTKLYDENDYHIFFGSGEFPIMVLKIVRIGNTEYSFYTIER